MYCTYLCTVPVASLPVLAEAEELMCHSCLLMSIDVPILFSVVNGFKAC